MEQKLLNVLVFVLFKALSREGSYLIHALNFKNLNWFECLEERGVLVKACLECKHFQETDSWILSSVAQKLSYLDLDITRELHKEEE